MANRFILNETSYHGFGAIKNIVPEIQARGFKNILVASDASLVKFGVTQKVTGLLDEAGIKYELFTDIKPNPTIENVLAGVEAAKKINADAIIAIGGGSSMDTAKAVGIIMTNPQHADVRSLEGAVSGTKPCRSSPSRPPRELLRKSPSTTSSPTFRINANLFASILTISPWSPSSILI